MLIDYMKKTFAERCRKNPSYSLRSFSRSLGMDSSTVSAIMNGKRPLTIKSARKIIQGLDVSNPVEAQSLLSSTFADEKDEIIENYRPLSIETAETIAFWQHYAILALLELEGFKGNARNISERLNIPLGIVWECMGRLERLSLVEKDKNGWKLTGNNMSTPSDIPSATLREGHRQYIQKALHSLEHDPVDIRDISNITMAVSKARLPAAKKMIREFRRKISTYMEDGKRDSVYQLNIQLFPLTEENAK